MNLEDVKFALRQDNWDSSDAVAPGDLLIVRTNGSKSLIGRSVLIREEFGQLVFFASYLIRFRLLSLEDLSHWVAAIWDTAYIRNWIEQHLSNSAGQYNVNSTNLSRVLIPIPPLNYRRNVLLTLDQLLTLIQQLEQTLRNSEKRAERLRQAILREAFAGRLVPQDPNDEPASALLEKIHAARQVKKRNSKS